MKLMKLMRSGSNIPELLLEQIYSWRHSSAMHQGILSIGIFLLSLVLLSGVTFFKVHGSLEQQRDERLQHRMNVLVERAADKDWENPDINQEKTYKNMQKAFNTDDTFFSIISGDELQKMNAVARAVLSKEGYGSLDAQDIGKEVPHSTRYRLLVQHYKHILIVGENDRSGHAILKTVIRDFFINGLVALFLTAVLVTYLGSRSCRQIKRIEEVLQHAAHGRFGVRINTLGKNNDLAHVSAQINAMLSRLENTVHAMSDISANIAHELKTPIARLRNDLTQALNLHDQHRDGSMFLQAAYDESTHITETFDALLRIAQIESGVRQARFETLNVHSLLATILGIYAEVAEDAGMLLRYPHEQTEQVLIVRGDKELLIQMLANLVENAIRYCPPGTQIVMDAKRVSLNGKTPTVWLCVADNGEGIPPEERERVFQRLYRMNKSRDDQRGTGLGLSLVKAIIDLHEANIRLQDNEPGLLVAMEFIAIEA